MHCGGKQQASPRHDNTCPASNTGRLATHTQAQLRPVQGCLGHTARCGMLLASNILVVFEEDKCVWCRSHQHTITKVELPCVADDDTHTHKHAQYTTVLLAATTDEADEHTQDCTHAHASTVGREVVRWVATTQVVLVPYIQTHSLLSGCLSHPLLSPQSATGAQETACEHTHTQGGSTQHGRAPACLHAHVNVPPERACSHLWKNSLLAQSAASAWQT